MKVYCNGRVVELPDPKQGVSVPMLMRAAGVNPARQQIVIHRPDGRNEILNPANIKTIRPESHLTSIMLRDRGHES
jgi:hypothetical protein